VTVIIETDGLELGKPVGSGHCVALMQRKGNLPITSRWRRGAEVRGNAMPRGTAIATFSDAGAYENAVDGRSHAAILLEETDDGLRVLDQWIGRPLAERVIRFKNGAGQKCDDGDQYFAIEVA